MHRTYRTLTAWSVVAVLSALSTIRAEVIDSAPGGFSLRNTVEIASPPSAVYDVLVKEIGNWWDSAHTYSGNSHNLSIQDKPNGCFCESFEPDGNVRHGVVVFASRGKSLRLSGGLGPLQEMAVVGTMSYEFKSHESETQLTMIYRVGGYHPDGLATLATGVDSVLRMQLIRLKSYIEKGSPKSD